MKPAAQRNILVYADWKELEEPALMGTLKATPGRGKEIFSFEYDRAWLEGSNRLELDPHLQWFDGPQYARESHQNFGLFLDSSPDRWGRQLMERREQRAALHEKRPSRKLVESDFLLGVHDAHRIGALRFKLDAAGPFLDDRTELASPPWTSLSELEAAAGKLEQKNAESDTDYDQWLRMLIAPGGSLGGARPKASVRDENGHLWIAKFPSVNDAVNVGAWEMVAWRLAKLAGIEVPDAQVQRFNSEHLTYITRRFDRNDDGTRTHFASAMTLLGHHDGDAAATGASYLELADFLIRNGAQTTQDLDELWQRIVLSVCISNVDDHLRNHGFLLVPGKGWRLAPAFDVNPTPHSDGLTLNISETGNALDLDLVRSVAGSFRVKPDRREKIIDTITHAVRQWRPVATAVEISRAEQEKMASAFAIAESAGN